jgi:hypothetical protein
VNFWIVAGSLKSRERCERDVADKFGGCGEEESDCAWRRTGVGVG